ncbi:MAG: hypothetical protein JNL38_27230 [Myxococcales bacterium]|jgi:hypothetical protein|nr:hypothetical protein [Myxococcales bacterium]
MSPDVTLAPGAEDNGFASMLCDLLRQNLEAKPHKMRDFNELHARVALVADDADVACTLDFQRGRVTVHGGVYGVPDVTIRGQSEAILSLSNLPVTTRLGLPIPRDPDGRAVLRGLVQALGRRELSLHGAVFRLGVMSRLGRVMSVDG